MNSVRDDIDRVTRAFGIRPGLNDNLLSVGTDGIVQDRVADTGRIENQITGFRALFEHFRVQFLAERKQNRPPHQGHAAFLHHPTTNETPVHRHGDG